MLKAASLQKHWPLGFALVLLTTLTALYFRDLKYRVSADHIAYLSIAKRYASGDLPTAINAYWSPLGIWVVAVLMKLGLEMMKAAVLSSLLSAYLYLYASFRLFHVFSMQRLWLWCLGVAISYWLATMLYYQLFNDIYAAAFYLMAISEVIKPSFIRSKSSWWKAAVLLVLAFYAKAYMLPITLATVTLCYLLVWRKQDKGLTVIKRLLAMLGLMALLIAPWVLALHHKYGIWTTSYSGTYNLRIYQHGRSYFDKQYRFLVPPAYPNAVSYWEDPFTTTEHSSERYRNVQPFLARQYDYLNEGSIPMFVFSMNRLSIFLLSIWVAALFVLFYRPIFRRMSQALQLLVVFMCLYPLGYFFIHFVERFLWPLIPLVVVFFYSFLEAIRQKFELKNIWVMPLLIAYSLTPFARTAIAGMRQEGRKEYEDAKKLKALGISGSFAANTRGHESYTPTTRYAFWAGMHYYTFAYNQEPTHSELLEEMKKYGVHYFFRFYKNEQERHTPFLDEQGYALPDITQGKIEGLQVFDVLQAVMENRETKKGITN